jgi:PRC-barrel domain
MPKRFLPVCLLGSLMIPAMAQAQAPQTGFLTDMPPGASRLSDLIGVEVIGSDINRIGEVEDVLVAPDGSVSGVVLGVGGVLGMGEKSVAVPYANLLWNYEASPTSGPSSSNTGGARQEDGGFQVRQAESTNPGPAQPDVTGTVGNPEVPGEGLQPKGATMPVTGGGEPKRAVLRMTGEEVKNLPELTQSR